MENSNFAEWGQVAVVPTFFEDAKPLNNQQRINVNDALTAFLEEALNIEDLNGVEFLVDFTQDPNNPEITSKATISKEEYKLPLATLKSSVVGYGFKQLRFVYETQSNVLIVIL